MENWDKEGKILAIMWNLYKISVKRWDKIIRWLNNLQIF